jgi:MAP kinase substrate 1
MMQQHNTTRSTSTTKLSSSASSAMAAKGKRGVINLQGPRPPPLTILPSGTTSSSSSSPQHRRPAKRPRRVNVSGSGSDDNVRAPPALAAAPGPLILYEHTPKVIHVHADEFKALVQRLTGRQPTPPGRGGGGGQEAVSRPLPSQQTAGNDPLVLTLGQQHAALPPPLPLDDHHAPLLPSPGGAVGGLLLSPGSFLFSPITMQAIQELIR